MKNKKIGLCLVIATYVFLLVTFLITAIVGLRTSIPTAVDLDKPTATSGIGIYNMVTDPSVEDSIKFLLSAAGIVAIVFAALSLISGIASIIVNKKQISALYMIIALVLVIAFMIAILTSKPSLGGTDDKEISAGWLFKTLDSSEQFTKLSYATGGYVMIAFAAITGLAYAGSAGLQAKKLFFSK